MTASFEKKKTEDEFEKERKRHQVETKKKNGSKYCRKP